MFAALVLGSFVSVFTFVILGIIAKGIYFPKSADEIPDYHEYMYVSFEQYEQDERERERKEQEEWEDLARRNEELERPWREADSLLIDHYQDDSNFNFI